MVVFISGHLILNVSCFIQMVGAIPLSFLSFSPTSLWAFSSYLLFLIIQLWLHLLHITIHPILLFLVIQSWICLFCITNYRSHISKSLPIFFILWKEMWRIMFSTLTHSIHTLFLYNFRITCMCTFPFVFVDCTISGCGKTHLRLTLSSAPKVSFTLGTEI